jgi:hypothetical protein
MNKIFFCIALFSILSSSIYAQARKLRGVWKIQTVDGKVPDGADKDITLTFYKNGDFEFSSKEEKDQGRWMLLDDKKTIKISGLDIGGSETITIVEINRKTASLDNQGNIAVFEKIGKAPKRKSAKPSRKMKKLAKQLHGCWKVVDIVGIPAEMKEEMPALEIFMQFNKDGSIWMQEPNRSVAGIWKLESEHQLSISFEGRSEAAEFKLENDSLEISDQGRAGFRLVRSDKKLEQPEITEEEPIEEPFEPDVVIEAPLFNTEDVAGDWKVLKMDGDEMEDRNIRFKITENGKFEIREDGETIRSGEWKFNSSSQLYIKDTSGYSNNYTIKTAGNNKIMLSDYYGEIEMRKE